MAKSKIKSRKERKKEYDIKFIDIPKDDPVERVMYCLGNKLTEDKVKKIIDRKNKILNELTYSCMKFTYYEKPVSSHRPRHRNMNGFISSYVPNAKENKKHFESLVNTIEKNIGIIDTPMYVTLDAYYEMPATTSLEESVLFEAKILNPVSLSDVDNVFKSYTDQMIETLILNDDLIYKSRIQSYYSFLPRVELCIYYEDSFASKYIYKKITSRKSFERLKDHIMIKTIL